MLSQRIIKCICLVLILLSTNQEGAMSQSAVTEKRTVISSSSSNVDDALADNEYEPSSGSRASNIMSRSIATPLPLSTAGGSSIAGTSTGGEQDTKENERFTNYVEKVRFLEAQNKKLATEIEYLGTSWGKEINHIKQIYEAELSEVRKHTDDLSRDKAALEVNRSSIQEQIGDLNRQLDEARGYHQKDQDQINKLNQQLTEYETNISRSRRTIKSLETERARDKATINRQQQEMEKLRIDLDNETLTRLHAEHRRQTLEEDMEFVRRVHKQELNKLIAIAYRDTTAENREFWKNELAQAIREIQEEYDNNENPTQR